MSPVAALTQDAVPDAVPVPAVHPERTEDPMTVRWHVAGPPTWDAGHAGDPALEALVAAGVLAAVDVGAGGVTTTLAAGRTWAGAGGAVRAAVQTAVAARSRGAEVPADPDAALRRLATQVLAADVGPYAAGHGGGIELLGVSGGVVDVRMVGACHGCPAAGWTVQGRLERLLRGQAPWLVEVRIVERPAPLSD